MKKFRLWPPVQSAGDGWALRPADAIEGASAVPRKLLAYRGVNGNYPGKALAYRGVGCKHSISLSVRLSVRHLKPLTTQTGPRNQKSPDSTVNVVAAGRWPASSFSGPQQDPAVTVLLKFAKSPSQIRKTSHE